MQIQLGGRILEHYEDFGTYRGVDASYWGMEACAKCGVKGQTTLYCPKCMKCFCVSNCIVIKDIKEGTTNVGTEKFCPVCKMKLQTWRTIHEPELTCDNCSGEITRDDSNIVIKVDALAYICDRCLDTFNQVVDLISKNFSVEDLKDENKFKDVRIYVHKNLRESWELPIDYPIFYVMNGWKRKEKI